MMYRKTLLLIALVVSVIWFQVVSSRGHSLDNCMAECYRHKKLCVMETRCPDLDVHAKNYIREMMNFSRCAANCYGALRRCKSACGRMKERCKAYQKSNGVRCV